MKKDINIIVFGDSITYGASDKEIGGWVNRLRMHLENNDEDVDYNVFNMGISGQIIEEVLDRFEYEFKTRFDKEERTILIFAIGINDTQDVNGVDRTDIEKFKANIITLIKQAKHYTDEIYFIGLTNVDESRVVPLPWNTIKSYFNKKIRRFDNELEKICNIEYVNYIKMFNDLTVDELADGLHPDNNGHQKMFEKIIENIL